MSTSKETGLSTTISVIQYYILIALRKSGPLHAYGVLKGVQDLNHKVHSFPRVNAPSIYKNLAMLEEKGLVKSTPLTGLDSDGEEGLVESLPGRPQRKFQFEVTSTGIEASEDHREYMKELSSLWEPEQPKTSSNETETCRNVPEGQLIFS